MAEPKPPRPDPERTIALMNEHSLHSACSRVAELEAEKKRLRQAWSQRAPDGEPCAICGDIGHQAFECRFHPLRPSPRWRCFHCNEVFNDDDGAREHFGDNRHGQPMCITELEAERDAAVAGKAALRQPVERMIERGGDYSDDPDDAEAAVFSGDYNAVVAALSPDDGAARLLLAAKALAEQAAVRQWEEMPWAENDPIWLSVVREYRALRAGDAEREAEEADDVANAGMSTCPLCGRRWLVTPLDDCMMPTCGCYGHDTGPANPTRPCENCGIAHAMGCPKMEADAPATTATPG